MAVASGDWGTDGGSRSGGEESDGDDGSHWDSNLSRANKRIDELVSELRRNTNQTILRQRDQILKMEAALRVYREMRADLQRVNQGMAKGNVDDARILLVSVLMRWP